MNPPAAPSGLNATSVSSSAIDLSWLDNANDETSFNIDRSIDGTGLEPDIELEITEEEYAAGEDPQLDRAIELLEEMLVD